MSDYLLWSWTNPRPQSPVQSVEIVPKGPAFVVAAVTLGLVDEHPFARQGRREAVITFTYTAAVRVGFRAATSFWSSLR